MALFTLKAEFKRKMYESSNTNNFRDVKTSTILQVAVLSYTGTLSSRTKILSPTWPVTKSEASSEDLHASSSSLSFHRVLPRGTSPFRK